jgi:hypothetical protein
MEFSNLIVAGFSITATLLTTISLFIIKNIKEDVRDNKKITDKSEQRILSIILDNERQNSVFRENVIGNYTKHKDVEVKLDHLAQKMDVQFKTTLDALYLRLEKLELHASNTELGIKGLTVLLPQMVDAMKELNKK